MTRLALFLLLLAAPLFGQSVKLPAEVKGMPGEWIVVAPEIDGGKPRWRLGPGLEEVNLAALFGDEIAAKAKGKVVKAATAGVYRLEAWNAKGDVASEIAVCDVFIGTPGPTPPTPPPGPQPPGPVPPVVTPITGKVFVTIFDDASKRTQAIGAVIDSAAIRGAVVAKGHKYRVIDVLGDVDESRGFAPFIAKAGGAPCVVVQSLEAATSGKVLHQFALPPNEAETLAKLKALGVLP